MELPELPLRARKKDATRRALLGAAHRRFHRQGFEATTLDEVAADVGIDGAGASAEEAAVHVIESEDGPLTEPEYDVLEQDEGADPESRPW
jgi:hypothetical protein